MKIERNLRGKIKQYTPAKLDRLYRYFNGKAKEERTGTDMRGEYKSVRFNGGPVFVLRLAQRS